MNACKEIQLAGRQVYLYRANEAEAPLILVNTFAGDGLAWQQGLEALGAPPCHLAVIGNLNWEEDLSPWACPPLADKEPPCTGGADVYLDSLTTKVLPHIVEELEQAPTWIGLVGYSLAGLFALYAMYKTPIFSRIASVSGSLWFPDFTGFVKSHDLLQSPDRLYVSLGDKEAKTRHFMLQTVEENTRSVVDYYQEKGLPVQFEMNPGNHFKDEDKRIVKGIMALLS